MLLSPSQRVGAKAPYRVYNIGNNQPEKLMYFIETLAKAIGKKSEKEFLPMQSGDIYQTYAAGQTHE